MADTVTTNYNLIKPEVGSSTDTWGGKLNDNLDALDVALKSVSDAADAAQADATSALNTLATPTAANTPDTIVKRDASGNFSAGMISANLTGNTIGNASTATALATARNISLTGDASGSALFNGTANVSIPVVIADDSHNHIIANVDGLQGALDGKAATNGSGAFGTWGINVTGNAGSATVLQTARTINGVSFNGSGNIQVDPYVGREDSTNASRYMTFVGNTTAGYKGLYVDVDGPIYNPATADFTVSGAVTAYSDIRLKDNIEIIGDALEKVSQIRGVTYTKKDSNFRRQAGVIAQEVEKVLPEVVIENEDGIKSVAYGNLVGLLIEAIKEIKAEVNALKNKG